MADITLELLWEKKNYQPTEKQRSAILHESGPLLITAGPGTGKTSVLVWRVIHLIVFHDVKPEEIFLSTFTEKAAKELKERLQSLLSFVSEISGGSKGPYDISKMYMGTMHSLCQRLLSDRDMNPDGKRLNRKVLMDDLEQYLFIARKKNYERILKSGDIIQEERNIHSESARVKRINNLIDSKEGSRITPTIVSKFHTINHLISAFNRFQEEVLSPEELFNFYNVENKSNKDKIRLIKMYNSYLELLNENRLIDFSGIQKETIDYIRVHREHVGKKFKYVIIDEYQDTNFVQEQLVFLLSEVFQNLCVVGDDDQALYRFRGATVDNLVNFKKRYSAFLKNENFDYISEINLEDNFRSDAPIVDLYKAFIKSRFDGEDSKYRLSEKKLSAHRNYSSKKYPSVLTNSVKTNVEESSAEIAKFIKSLVVNNVAKENEIAFLYPSLKNTATRNMIEALTAEGLNIYAPRAESFLHTDEAKLIFGFFIKIFDPNLETIVPIEDRPESTFNNWQREALDFFQNTLGEDPGINQLVDYYQGQLVESKTAYSELLDFAEKNGWNLEDYLWTESDVTRDGNKLEQLKESNFSSSINNRIRSISFQNYTKNKPTKTAFIYLCSLDWGVLDLFYKITAFPMFQEMFDLADIEKTIKIDEGPINNLAMISKYLGNYAEKYGSFLTPEFLKDGKFVLHFFYSYLQVLSQRDESGFENPEDPFPEGRIPFLTIHQSKGLEFKVVVLGSTFSIDRDLKMEKLIQEIKKPSEFSEPYEKMHRFDINRMYYVALSRPKKLLVIADLPLSRNSGTNRLQEISLRSEKFKCATFDQFDVKQFKNVENQNQSSEVNHEEFVGFYSFTADYQSYKRCPRNYMFFRKYGFVPSRSQTMFYGSLVHGTIEDMHYETDRRIKNEN